MIIIVYNKENIITRVLSCANREDANKLGVENYKIYNETNAYIGLSLDFIDENGMIKSDKVLLEENLIQLQEDEVLENDQIRKLTLLEQVEKGLIILKDNEEIRDNVIVVLSDDEMREKFPNRYPSDDSSEESPEKTVIQAITDKNNEISLKT